MPSTTESLRTRLEADIRERVKALEEKVLEISRETVNLDLVDARRLHMLMQVVSLSVSSDQARNLYRLYYACEKLDLKSFKSYMDVLFKSNLSVGSLYMVCACHNGHNYAVGDPILLHTRMSDRFVGVSQNGTGNHLDWQQLTFMLEEELDNYFENIFSQISDDDLRGLLPATEEDLNEWF